MTKSFIKYEKDLEYLVITKAYITDKKNYSRVYLPKKFEGRRVFVAVSVEENKKEVIKAREQLNETDSMTLYKSNDIYLCIRIFKAWSDTMILYETNNIYTFALEVIQ